MSRGKDGREYDGFASFPQGSLFDMPEPNCPKCGRVMLGNGQCAWCDMTIDTPKEARREQTHACAGMACQVCHADARAKANKAIGRVHDHADPQWLAAAGEALWRRSRMGQPFTTDEVMEDIDDFGVTTHDARALGPVVRRFISKGVIVHTGEYVKSRRRHGSPIPVYVGI
jgi:hypothetical protein